MKNKIIFAITVVCFLCFSRCKVQDASAIMKKQYDFYANTLEVTIRRPPQQKYYDLIKGLVVDVIPTQPKEEVTLTRFRFSGKNCFYAPTVDYAHSMGLKEISPNTDYRLFVTIEKADFDNGTGSVEISVSLKDAHGTEVFSQRHISSSDFAAYSANHVNRTLSFAYTKALEQINWNRIASFLRVEQLPKEEPDKQVQGYGYTAMEQTIIRWDVQSRPQGADVFWRVVSKTPEVKSTNNKYIMTTPYEATKTLDIRGLTYQTSGDVRIILRCEKDGYYPQEKEYNVRMILDQEEISAFFRLVEEE